MSSVLLAGPKSLPASRQAPSGWAPASLRATATPPSGTGETRLFSSSCRSLDPTAGRWLCLSDFPSLCEAASVPKRVVRGFLHPSLLPQQSLLSRNLTKRCCSSLTPFYGFSCSPRTAAVLARGADRLPGHADQEHLPAVSDQRLFFQLTASGTRSMKQSHTLSISDRACHLSFLTNERCLPTLLPLDPPLCRVVLQNINKANIVTKNKSALFESDHKHQVIRYSIALVSLTPEVISFFEK